VDTSHCSDLSVVGMCKSTLEFEMQHRPNKALQLTANPLRGLFAAELGR